MMVIMKNLVKFYHLLYIFIYVKPIIFFDSQIPEIFNIKFLSSLS